MVSGASPVAGVLARRLCTPLPSSPRWRPDIRHLSVHKACVFPQPCRLSFLPVNISARLPASGRVLGRRPNAQHLDTPPVRYAASWLAFARRMEYCVASRSGEGLACTVTFRGHSHNSGHCLSRGVSPAYGQHLVLDFLHVPGQRLQGTSRLPSASVLFAASRALTASTSDASSSK